VTLKKNLPDQRGTHIIGNIHDIGITSVRKMYTANVYYLKFKRERDETKTAREAADRIASEILYDPVIEEYEVYTGVTPGGPVGCSPNCAWSVVISYLPGVMDTTADTIREAAEVIGVRGLEEVKSGHEYFLCGEISRKDVEGIVKRLLANPLVEQWYIRTCASRRTFSLEKQFSGSSVIKKGTPRGRHYKA